MAKILIIEDDDFLAKMLARALEDNKHEVLLAANGKEGLAKVADKPDFILLDIMLPDTDGVTILKQLKENPETDDIPVVVATNLGDEATISSIMDAGGKEYIVKSDWSINDVVKKIEENLK